jgi:hypothetical protein
MWIYYFLKLRKLWLILFVSLFLINSVSSQELPLIEVLDGTEEILLKFKRGDNPKKFELLLDENSNEFDAFVKIVTPSLWDRERSKVISGELINFTSREGINIKSGFVVSKNDRVPIFVEVDPDSIDPGTYVGKIIISYGNASDNLFFDIIIPLKIQIGEPLWFALIPLAGGITIGAILNFAGVTIGKSVSTSYYSMSGIKANPGPLIAGIIVVVIFLLLTISLYYPRLTDFGAEWIDYINAIIFGLGEYGSGKLASDAINKARNH